MNKRQLRILIDQIKRKFRFRGGLNFRRKRHRIQRDHVWFYGIWLLEILVVILAAYLLTKGFGMRVICSGESMESTIAENTPIWVDRVLYKLKAPKVGDVIVFLPKGNRNASYNTKRVIAVPGDTVLIENGKLYINGELTELSHLADDTSIKDAGRADDGITLDKDEYFVLGDNVNNSEDSRYESVGNVKRSEIYGKAWFNLSLNEFGTID